MIKLFAQILIACVGLMLVAGAKTQKVADDSFRVMGNIVIGLVVIAGGSFLLTHPSILVDTAMGPEPKTDPATVGPRGVQFEDTALPWVERFLVAVLVILFARSLLAAAGPRAKKAVARREARLAFVQLHTGPLVAPTRERLVARWGDRPDAMTRCVECGRNEWPACRCTLIRNGWPMTPDDIDEAPISKPSASIWGSPIPPWGTPGGRPLEPIPDSTGSPLAAPLRRARHLATTVAEKYRSLR